MKNILTAAGKTCKKAQHLVDEFKVISKGKS